VQVRREDLRDARGRRPGGPPGPGRPGAPGAPGTPGAPGGPARLGAISVERTNTVIKPNAAITAPQPLGKNERGRLGTNPPRAAQGAPAVAPLQQQPPPGSTAPPSGVQRQTPAIQQPPDFLSRNPRFAAARRRRYQHVFIFQCRDGFELKLVRLERRGTRRTDAFQQSFCLPRG